VNTSAPIPPIATATAAVDFALMGIQLLHIGAGIDQPQRAQLEIRRLAVVFVMS
jgi:hypothetical protein